MNFKEYQKRNIEVICLMLLKVVDVFALLPYEPVTIEKMLFTTTQILGEYLKQNLPSLVLIEFSWKSVVFPKSNLTRHHIPLAADDFLPYPLL